MNKWHKFDPDKGLPFGKTVIVLRKDGTMVAGARSVNDKNCWDAYIGHTIFWGNKNSEILYWTDQLGTPPKKVIRVFISQPMTGRTDEEITAQRAKALIQVAKRYPDCLVLEIDSFNKGALNNSDPITELGHCVSLMTDADVAVFCDGWGDSKGCNVEHEVAVQYDIPYIYL